MCSTSHVSYNVFKVTISPPFRFQPVEFQSLYTSRKPGLQEASPPCSPTEPESLPALELPDDPDVSGESPVKTEDDVVAPTDLDSCVSRDGIEVSGNHEMMMEVEARNQDMPSPGDSAPASPQPDCLRRRDQIAASRGDSPAAKGRGRGRGRGKGRGRGRSAKKNVETEGHEAAHKTPKSRAKRSKEPKSQSVAVDPQDDPPSKSKKTQEKKKRAASAPASSKRKAPDTEQAEPEVEAKDDVAPAAPKKRAPKTKKPKE